MRTFLNTVIVFLVMAFIVVGSFVPVTWNRSLILGLHGLAYFLLAGALLLVFNDTARGHGEAVLLAVLFGVVIEVLQGMVPYRSMAAVDIVFNTAGASLVLLDHHFDAVTRVVALEDRWIERYLL